MAKKTQEERIQDAADFVEEAAANLLPAEPDDETPVEDEVVIYDDAADDLPPDSVLATVPEAAETLALIDRALESEAVDDWNQVAERIYWLDHIKHQTPSLKASKLARILERLP